MFCLPKLKKKNDHAFMQYSIVFQEQLNNYIFFLRSVNIILNNTFSDNVA